MIYNLIRSALFDSEDEPEFCYNNPMNCPEHEANSTFDFTLDQAVAAKARLEALYGIDHQYTIQPKEETK